MTWWKKLLGVAPIAGTPEVSAHDSPAPAASVPSVPLAPPPRKSDDDLKQAARIVSTIKDLRWTDLAAARQQLTVLQALAASAGSYQMRQFAEEGAALLRDRAVKEAHGLIGKPAAPLRYRVPPITTWLKDNPGAAILDASDCVALQSLPSGLRVAYLNLTGCSSLKALPADLKVRYGRLTLRGCTLLTRLPDGLGPLHELDLAGCLNITALPDDLIVTGWIDVAGSGLKRLPARLADVSIRWNGVPVDERIAFRPDQLDASEIMAEPNAERRRVMMERFGFDKFMEAADAKVLDSDSDAGGPRRLLRVEVPGDEPLVCVSVICPSTQRQFMLRVPPTMTTCRQAIAWTAGFDDPGQYRPLIET